MTPLDLVTAVGNSKEAVQIAAAFTRKSDLIPSFDAAAASTPPVPEVVSRTLQQLVERGVDLRPIFARVDRFNHSDVPADPFRAALSSSGIRLNPPTTPR
jgi:hypothetical protein